MLSEQSEEILSRFTADGYYLYIRPMSSAWFKCDEHFVYWTVDVEFRNAKWRHWKVSGPNLDAVLKRLHDIVPVRASIESGFVPADKDASDFGSGLSEIDPSEMRTEITSAGEARKELPEPTRPDPGISEKTPKKDKSKKKKSKKSKKK